MGHRPRYIPPIQSQPQKKKTVNSLLDNMEKGREYASITDCIANGMDVATEVKRVISEISKLRNRPTICYLANVIKSDIKSSIAIDLLDDLPFSEMVDSINNCESIDIILVTPGGSAEQVAKFVSKLRNRFTNVGFILPFMAMSAGTIFCLSGDELIMDERAYIGPIDPQVRSKSGVFVPAQALLTLIDEIQKRGQEQILRGNKPLWSDVLILNNLDAKEIGNAINASQYSMDLVADYLSKYKFKTWVTHTSTGKEVTPDEREERAKEVAGIFCNHSLWRNHSSGITRETAHEKCKLKIIYPENIHGLHEALRKFWALIHWMFENTNIAKMYVSENYSLFRIEKQ